MGIIAWIVVGAIAGYIAAFIMHTHNGILLTVILGIVGAVVGGWLAGVFLNLKDPTGINVETIVVSVDRRDHRRLRGEPAARRPEPTLACLTRLEPSPSQGDVRIVNEGVRTRLTSTPGNAVRAHGG